MADRLGVPDLPAAWRKTAMSAGSTPVAATFNVCARELDSALARQEADATLPLENALSELIDKICHGLDSGDLLADARAASKALDAAPPAAQAYTIKTESGELPCSLAVSVEWAKSEEYITRLEAAQAVDLDALRREVKSLKEDPRKGDEVFRCGYNGALNVVLDLIDQQAGSPKTVEPKLDPQQAVDLDGLRELADAVVITNATGNERLFLGAVEKLLARVRALIDQQVGKGVSDA